MAKVILKNGVTSVILRVKIMDSTSTTGGAKTGLTFSSSGLIISTIADNEASPTVYTAAGSTIETITTLGTFAAPTATKCRFKEVDSTNHPGLYEIQIADARWAVSNARSIIITVVGATGAAQVDAEIQLSQIDVNDATAAGISRLDAAVSSRMATFTLPTNFSALAITAGGEVTVGTNNDKTGYALTSGERTSIADALLDRDMSIGTDSGSTTVRTVRQALRPLRNMVDLATTPGTMIVKKEDDTTTSWTAALTTDNTALPITKIDPAG